MKKKIGLAILGATGTVGQKMICMMESHPLFEVQEMMASDNSNGRRFGDIVHWREIEELPERISNIILKDAKELESDYVLSFLPSDAAHFWEPYLAQQGKIVVSNASALRMAPLVPLIIPELNGNHLQLSLEQGTPGKIITNPNCSTVFAAMALAPILELTRVHDVSLVTLQAISGAGYPGVSSNDILGNIIPYIENEEEKIEEEIKKILGKIKAPLEINVMAHVHRVPVAHGHTVAMHLRTEKPLEVEEVVSAYSKWNEKFPGMFKYHDKADRPQPLRDIGNYDQRCHIGRLKKGQDPNFFGLIAQGHNLVRGAAGAALLNLELAHQFFKR